MADKDRKAFANELESIYHAPSEEQALESLERVTEKWSVKYPNSMKSWKQNWDAICSIFKFSAEVRKVIYMINAIELLNSIYRKLNRQRSVFPSDTALLKALYLTTFEAIPKPCQSGTGQGIRGTEQHIRRQTFRVKVSGKNKEREISPILDIPRMCCYI